MKKKIPASSGVRTMKTKDDWWAKEQTDASVGTVEGFQKLPGALTDSSGDESMMAEENWMPSKVTLQKPPSSTQPSICSAHPTTLHNLNTTPPLRVRPGQGVYLSSLFFLKCTIGLYVFLECSHSVYINFTNKFYPVYKVLAKAYPWLYTIKLLCVSFGFIYSMAK